MKGVYHINAVDCVTQYEGVATCERISEAFLIPVLEALLQSFPFVILGFHSDNGSEYINRNVAQLLNKLLIEEQTKSRSRHSNDNAQAESKNGAIVRKHLGYAHIPQRFAGPVNAFCRDYLNPYINFHRPCLFAETVTDAKGKQRKRYPYRLMTPYEKLKSLPLVEIFLKPGVSFEKLDTEANAMSVKVEPISWHSLGCRYIANDFPLANQDNQAIQHLNIFDGHMADNLIENVLSYARCTDCIIAP